MFTIRCSAASLAVAMLALAHSVPAQEYYLSAGAAYQGPFIDTDWVPGPVGRLASHYTKRRHARIDARGNRFSLWIDNRESYAVDGTITAVARLKFKGLVFKRATNGQIPVQMHLRVQGSVSAYGQLPGKGSLAVQFNNNPSPQYQLPTSTWQLWTTGSRKLYANSPKDFELRITLKANVSGNGGKLSGVTAEARCEIPTDRDLFVVPQGVTVDSADGLIKNNRWVGPVTSVQPCLEYGPMPLETGKQAAFRTSGLSQGDVVLWYVGTAFMKKPIRIFPNAMLDIVPPLLTTGTSVVDAKGEASFVVPQMPKGFRKKLLYFQAFVVEIKGFRLHSSNAAEVITI